MMGAATNHHHPELSRSRFSPTGNPLKNQATQIWKSARNTEHPRFINLLPLQGCKLVAG
jgi:hypothetical protein